MVSLCVFPATIPSATAQSQPVAPVDAPTQEAWRAAIHALPLPKKGCFTANFPRVDWYEVGCVKAPQRPYPPALGSQEDTIGNGTDASADVKNKISQAIGSFDSVVVTSESGFVGGVAPLVANTYTLQLNTQFFSTAACNGQSGCLGWQQFIYSSSSGVTFMQYWLIGYIGSTNTQCPANWWNYSNDCYTNSSATTVHGGTRIPITQLAKITLGGKSISSGLDTVKLVDGAVAYSASGEDTMVDLASNWNTAEFNVFGDCCSSEAHFNSGAKLVVRITTDHGNDFPPACLAGGFTGETNSLSFVKTATPHEAGTPPGLVFTEASPKTSVKPCAAVTTVGN